MLLAACAADQPTDAVSVEKPDADDWTAGERDPGEPPVAEPEAPVPFDVLGWEPEEGRTTGGELVVIHGRDFVDGADVYFGSRRSADVTVYSDQVIHVRTPSHKPGLVALRVVSPSGSEVVHEDAFVFRDPVRVTSVAPAVGPASGGTPVTVVGEGFTSDTRVLIGGRLLIGLEIVDATTALGIAPPGTRGPQDVLAAHDLISARLADGFRYTAPPIIDALEPAAGPADGETLVTLIGENLHADAAVEVGGRAAPIVDATIFGTRLTVRVGPGEGDLLEGAADVMVTTADGVALAENAFWFTGPPTAETVVLNAFPKTVPEAGGALVTVTAYGLTDAALAGVNGVPADVVSVDPNAHQLVLRAPAGTGSADVEVTTSNGNGTLEDAFAYVFVPTIDRVTPAAGPIEGGQVLTIEGAGIDAALEVFVGALPATVLERSDGAIEVLTPPGSPGPADVRAVLEAGVAIATGAHDYRPDSPQVYALHPTYGAIAGGTLVTLYGAGFEPDAEVRFAKQLASEADVHSSAEIRVRSPKADKPTVVDVTVSDGAWSQTLIDAFSLFDPTSPYGGSWGPPIDGVVNVTVLDLYTTDPIPFAFVMLAHGGYEGQTDERGQITFSGPDLVGPQMVTAAKHSHTAYSVVEYDAENVTVHLIPMNPTSSGGGGGGSGPDDLLADLEGRVTGIGKYLVLPAGVQGRKTAYCQSTTPGPWETAPRPNTPSSQSDWAWADEAGEFWMHTHLSELAVVCIGGVVQDEANPEKSFLPLMMGVRRHIQPSSGETYPEFLEVPLTIPLLRNVPLRLDGAPLTYVNPATGKEAATEVRLRVALDFNSSGYWTTADMLTVGDDRFLLERQPTALVGDLDGVTYRILAEIEGKGNQAAVSGTRGTKLDLQDNDKVLHLLDGVWLAVDAGIPSDVHALWGAEPDSVWAVGADGLIAHGQAKAWFPQASPTGAHLRAIWGTSPTHAVAVGDSGAIVAFDGATWTVEDSATDADLRGVWGTAPDHMAAVGDEILVRRDGDGWTAHTAPTSLNAVWGPHAGLLYTVGDDGRLWTQENGQWSDEELDLDGIALRGITGDAGVVWMVGDLGTVVRWTAETGPELMDTPTTQTLNAITVTSVGVTAVGDKGTLLELDHDGWRVSNAPQYGGDLRGVWVAGGLSGTIAAGTREIILGPMLDFPVITSPVAPTLGGQSEFDYEVSWTDRGGHLPTFNFVEMMMGWGNYFPAWWAVVEAETQHVQFPELPVDPGINPFLEGNAVMFVHRVYKPGASADNFDFWDTYWTGTWQSWSSAVVPFTP